MGDGVAALVPGFLYLLSFGVLAKETFVVWLALLGLAGMATLAVLFSVGNGHLVLPWELERSGAIDDGMWQRAWQLTSDRGTLYIFGWLFPLGVFGLRRCPRDRPACTPLRFDSKGSHISEVSQSVGYQATVATMPVSRLSADWREAPRH